jgi:hypothetical protein
LEELRSRLDKEDFEEVPAVMEHEMLEMGSKPPARNGGSRIWAWWPKCDDGSRKRPRIIEGPGSGGN